MTFLPAEKLRYRVYIQDYVGIMLNSRRSYGLFSIFECDEVLIRPTSTFTHVVGLDSHEVLFQVILAFAPFQDHNGLVSTEYIAIHDREPRKLPVLPETI
jgi:hypothetical protein